MNTHPGRTMEIIAGAFVAGLLLGIWLTMVVVERGQTTIPAWALQ